MTDRNNVEIRTGDIVYVEGTYFQDDTGVFLVTRSPGDPCWVGDSYSLNRLVGKGKISTAANSVSSWPVRSYVTNHGVREEADRWNRDNATIRVMKPLENMSHVEKYFLDEARYASRQAKRMEARGLSDCPQHDNLKRSEEFFRQVADRVSGRTTEEGRRNTGKEYRYGMRLRGFSMGTAPTQNLKGVRDTDKAITGYWSILIYSVPLTREQVEQYELTPLKA